MGKRAREEDADITHTPKKARQEQLAKSSTKRPSSATPKHLKSILKDTTTPFNNRIADDIVLDKTPSRVLSKTNGTATKTNGTPAIVKIARNDASARKKSAAVLQKQAAAVDDDDDSDVDEASIAVAQKILGDDDAQQSVEDDDQAQAGADEEQPAPDAVPVKRGRGRPKGSKRARTPTPPPDMPAHEWYFFRNRTTADKTSSNALPSHLLLNHDDYRAQITAYHDPHADDIQRLKQLHARSFEQWQFELEQDFSICLYGYGSKRDLLLRFAKHLYNNIDDDHKIVVVNGYNASLGIKDVLMLLAAQVITNTNKIPNQVNILLEALLKALDQYESRIYLVIHNLDSPPLRKPALQAMIARLASHRAISLITSCDNFNFGLLWDLNLLRQYNFVFHDATTFEPWSVEIDSVEEVNLLLGRSSRHLTGKDGIGYVLRSLPENARNLFKILVTEQLMQDVEYNPEANANKGEDEEMLGASDEELAALQETPSKKGRSKSKKTKAAKVDDVEGVDYRALYHKAVQDFVCSSEVSFRALLKEFHDHQMIESRKDLMGTERLIVPFRREELESILEEL